jgi:hypothetical protein
LIFKLAIIQTRKLSNKINRIRIKKTKGIRIQEKKNCKKRRKKSGKRRRKSGNKNKKCCNKNTKFG